MRLHPENSRPAQLGAPTLARLGETERAKEWLERALFLDPEDSIAAYNAAKGGVVAAIAKERPIPLRFIGVGEGIDDLKPFVAAEFVDALVG